MCFSLRLDFNMILIVLFVLITNTLDVSQIKLKIESNQIKTTIEYNRIGKTSELNPIKKWMQHGTVDANDGDSMGYLMQQWVGS